MNSVLGLVERGIVPDWLTRWGICRLLATRLRQEQRDHSGGGDNFPREAVPPRLAFQRLIDQLRCSPIALYPEKANEQHYELPPAFFRHVLGRRLKYSGCYWPSGVTSLDAAEEAMLDLTCRRAQLQDGMDMLELGCGWGVALALGRRALSQEPAVSGSEFAIATGIY